MIKEEWIYLFSVKMWRKKEHLWNSSVRAVNFFIVCRTIMKDLGADCIETPSLHQKRKMV